MGQSNGTGGAGSKFFTMIYKGKWTTGVPEGTEGAASRINKNDKEVWELATSQIDNEKFTSLTLRQAPFGQVYEVGMVDVNTGEERKITFSVSDQHLMTLCKMIPNINMDEPVDLILALDKERTAKAGKDRFGLLCKQGGAWIKHHWKRANLPEAKETRKGLDFTEQEDFLLGELEKAVDVFDKAITHHGLNTTILNTLGECYFQLGRLDEALVVWERSLEINKEQPQIQEYVEAIKEKK